MGFGSGFGVGFGVGFGFEFGSGFTYRSRVGVRPALRVIAPPPPPPPPTTSITPTTLARQVPGNLVVTTRCYGSCLPILTSTRSMDLRGAVHLRRVLALYPYQPLPDIAFHAPILCRYPTHEGLEVEEDVCMGCHQGSLYMGQSLDWCVRWGTGCRYTHTGPIAPPSTHDAPPHPKPV